MISLNPVKYLALCSAISFAFVSCSDDDSEDDSKENSEKITTTYTVSKPTMVSVSGTSITGTDTVGAFVNGRVVTLSDYAISTYLVTRDLYYKTMFDDKSVNPSPSSCDKNTAYRGLIAEGEVDSLRPVEMVSWFDAVYFCNRLSEIEGYDAVYTITDIVRDSSMSITSATVIQDITKNGYRLPTEAEWEFAARGGDTTVADWNYYYAGANSSDAGQAMDSGIDAVGWYNCNAATGTTTGRNPDTMHGTHQVGLKQPNRLGLYDMSGNLFEWCWDWSSDITAESVTNPTGPDSGKQRVLRGGSWLHGWAIYCGVKQTLPADPERRTDYYGFRIAQTLR